jgi:hypothetical protein
MKRPPAAIALLPALAALCGLLVLVGSFAPWAEAGPLATTYGIEADGRLTGIFGLTASAAAALRARQPDRRHWLLVVMLVAFCLSAVIGGIRWVDVDRLAADTRFAGTVHIGWGLPLVTIGAVAGGLLTFMQRARAL